MKYLKIFFPIFIVIFISSYSYPQSTYKIIDNTTDAQQQVEIMKAQLNGIEASLDEMQASIKKFPAAQQQVEIMKAQLDVMESSNKKLLDEMRTANDNLLEVIWACIVIVVAFAAVVFAGIFWVNSKIEKFGDKLKQYTDEKLKILYEDMKDKINVEIEKLQEGLQKTTIETKKLSIDRHLENAQNQWGVGMYDAAIDYFRRAINACIEIEGIREFRYVVFVIFISLEDMKEYEVKTDTIEDLKESLENVPENFFIKEISKERLLGMIIEKAKIVF
jgi:hypothetical protein